MNTLKTGVAGLLALALGLVILFGVLVALNVMQLPLINIQREVTQHSLQYVQTHQTMLLDYYADYQSGDDAHKAAAVIEVCQQSALLIREEWPAQAIPFIVTNCH